MNFLKEEEAGYGEGWREGLPSGMQRIIQQKQSFIPRCGNKVQMKLKERRKQEGKGRLGELELDEIVYL